MPRVAELSALYENLMVTPRAGRAVCRICFNFTRGYELCYACADQPHVLDAVAPISYSVAHEQLHHALLCYKRMNGEPARRLQLQLAAVLWRHLAHHERCLSAAVGVGGFALVTTVPSGERERDEHHPLRTIVGELVAPTRDRYRRLLKRSERPCQPRLFEPDKYLATARLGGEPILLIDDTWTSGASAQSAAAALKQAAAGPIAVVVIGRHLNRDWHENDRHLRELERPFDWRRCALCIDA